MKIVLEDTFKDAVNNAIEAGKITGWEIHFVRDGIHGCDDLNVVLAFQDAGYEYTIGRIYNSRYHDPNAVEVVFRYKGDK